MTRIDLTAQYTPEELASLTPEELQGMQDPDLYDGEDAGGTGEMPATGNVSDASTDPALQDEAAQRLAFDDLLARANGLETTPVAAAEPAPIDAAALDDPYRPTLQDYGYDPEKEIERLKALKIEVATLHNEADIDAVELANRSTALDEELVAAHMAKHALSNGLQYWAEKTVPRFLSAPENERFSQSPILHQALDTRVRELQTTTYAKDPFHPAVLATARQEVLAELGLAAAPAPKPAAPEKRTAPAPQAERRIPPTLGSMPTAGDEPLDNNSALFAHMERLSGEQFEQALEKLSPAQQAAYLRG